jgi:small subunit ribosomal protein S21e
MLSAMRSSASNRLITAKDHASVQINVGRVGEDGVLTGEFDTIAMCGFVRRKGLGDDAFYRVAKAKGFYAPAAKPEK